MIISMNFCPVCTHNECSLLLQVRLAKRLVEAAGFADKVFFCNSGTEATEAAIKFSRKWARVKAGVDPQVWWHLVKHADTLVCLHKPTWTWLFLDLILYSC